MIYLRKGFYVYNLIALLSVIGEFPFRSLPLLGNERVLKALVKKLTTAQTFRRESSQTEMTCRLLTLTGKSNAKTIRLYKAAAPILDWIYPGAAAYHSNAFHNNHFSGDPSHRDRNHRVAEAAAVFMRAGAEIRPYALPRLQNADILSVVPSFPAFYTARELKRVGDVEQNKTMFTRLVGAIFAAGECYPVYNTRASVMKWSGMGEFKAQSGILELVRLNADISKLDSAVLLGESGETALRTLAASEESRRPEFRFDGIYQNIYFIPMDNAGIRALKLFFIPKWRKRLLYLLFEPSDLSGGVGRFEYDAYVNGAYVLSHLDGNIARLIRFKQAMLQTAERCEVLCYPHQTGYVTEYIGKWARVKTIDLETVESELFSEAEI